MGACFLRPSEPDVDYAKPWGRHSYGFIVWGAKNVRPRGDPYFLCRIGRFDETFEEIPRGNGRRSDPVRRSHNPEWNSGFIIDTEGIHRPKLHIYLCDKEFFRTSDNIGFASADIKWLASQPEERTALTLHDTKGGEVFVTIGPPEILEKHGIDEFANFPRLAPNGKVRAIRARDVVANHPMILGVAPLPPQLRGIFWLTKQGRFSACMSFGGPTNDGGGCSPGRLQGNRYKVRVDGDRCWCDANATSGSDANARVNDVIYNFVFDDDRDPHFAQIYAQFKHGRGLVLKNDWFLDYEMILDGDGDDEFPGSVVWVRHSKLLGVGRHKYKLVQIFDERGTKLEPAFTKFVRYQESPSRPRPGTIFYRQLQSSE